MEREMEGERCWLILLPPHLTLCNRTGHGDTTFGVGFSEKKGKVRRTQVCS